MSDRITRLEADIGQISRALSALPSNFRMTINAYVTESTNRKSDAIFFL